MLLITFGCLYTSSQHACAATIKHSGTSGDLKWTIDSDGVLTISGTGNYDPYQEDCQINLEEAGFCSDSDGIHRCPPWTKYYKKIEKAVVNVKRITRTDYMFFGLCYLKTIDLSGFDTSNVYSMADMFGECHSLKKVDFSHFDTSEVTDMWGMFYHCTSLKSLDLSIFNTSKVEVMPDMFYGCSNLSTTICIKGNIDYWDDCFTDAATADDAAIYVTSSGKCTKKIVKKIIATKSDNSHVYLKANKVKGVSLSNVADGIKISWTKQISANGYEVYRKARGDSSYTKVKTGTSASFIDKDVDYGKQYSYKVRAYCKNDGKKVYGSYSSVKDSYRVDTTSVKAVTNVKKGSKVTWKKAKGVDGYCIYRKKEKGSFQKIKTIESASTITWIDQDVEHGKKYTYAVAPYIAKSLGKRSSGVVTYYVKYTVLNVVTTPKSGELTVTWKKKDGIDGYQIYYSTTSDFSSSTKSVKAKSDTPGVSIPGLKSGKVYYAKVRAFKTTGDRTYYSAWSTAKSVRVK